MARFLPFGAALLALLGPCPSGSASECHWTHPDATILQEPLRLLVVPPRAVVVARNADAKLPVAARAAFETEASDVMASLLPEMQCRLEQSGHHVLLSHGADAATTSLVEDAWEAYASRTPGICSPDREADAETLRLGAAATRLAAATSVDVLVFARSRTLVPSKKIQGFQKALTAIATDAKWPGQTVDLTWVEVATVDGRTGRLLTFSGVVEEGDLSKQHAIVVSRALDRALGDLPRAGSYVDDQPLRMIHQSKRLKYYWGGLSSDLALRAAEPRDPGTLPEPEEPPPAGAVSQGARLLVGVRTGAPGLHVENETAATIRMQATSGPLVELAPGDSVLLDCRSEKAWLRVFDAAGAELARASCGEAASRRVEARVVPAPK